MRFQLPLSNGTPLYGRARFVPRGWGHGVINRGVGHIVVLEKEAPNNIMFVNLV
jgi:hypothetical protein